MLIFEFFGFWKSIGLNKNDYDFSDILFLFS